MLRVDAIEPVWLDYKTIEDRHPLSGDKSGYANSNAYNCFDIAAPGRRTANGNDRTRMDVEHLIVHNGKPEVTAQETRNRPDGMIDFYFDFNNVEGCLFKDPLSSQFAVDKAKPGLCLPNASTVDQLRRDILNRSISTLIVTSTTHRVVNDNVGADLDP